MKKKVLMSLVLLAIIGTSAVFAQQPTLDKLAFSSGGTGVLNVREANKNISGEVVIPDTYDGKRVTLIPIDAFNDCTRITSLIILEGNMDIINGSFKNCTSLKSVTIPASVTRTGRLVFDGCTNLTSITIGKSNISLQGSGANSLPGDLDAKYKAGGAGTYTRQAGSNTWTKQGGFSLNGTWTRSDGVQITISGDGGQTITIAGTAPSGRFSRNFSER
jgi:hypothetical protein